MNRSFVLAFSILSTISLSAQDVNLFPHNLDGQWGYIDMEGEWAIPPQYDLADVFTEGVAAVQLDGFHFYINEDNERLHDSKFTYAYPFISGLAIVMNGENYSLINSDFQPVSDREYSQLYRRPSGVYLALIDDAQVEILDENGEQILAPSPGSTWPFGSALFVRHENNEVPGEIYNYKGDRVMSIDGLQAGACSDDYFVLQKRNTQGLGTNLVYSIEGELILEIPDSAYFYYSRHYTQSPTPFERYKTPIRSQNEMYHQPREWGLLYADGQFKPMGDSITNMSYMENDRCFAQINEDKWILIDQKGEQVSENRFSLPNGYLDDHDLPLFFVDGKALVEFEGRWVLIDRNGNLLKSGPSSRHQKAIFQIMDGKFALFFPVSNNNRRTYWNLQTGDTSESIYERIYVYNNSYLGCMKDGEITYVLPNGKVINPPATQQNSSLRPLNISAKLENWVTVSSPPLNSTSGFGGWGGSSNSYQPIQQDDLNGSLQVLRSERVVPWFRDSAVAAHTVTLANGTKDTLFFNAQDSRIYTIIEAKNDEGEWLPIENFRSSWCGNSYHLVYLPPGMQWTWTVPEFDGGVETELRIRVYKIFTREYDPDKELENEWDRNSRYTNSEEFEIYSATWKGQINPSQFYREMSYSPSGIMDPY